MKSVINKANEPKIEFATPQLLISKKDNKIIVLTNGKHSGVYFEGTCVNPEYNCGKFSTSWVKEEYTIFDGELTLEND